MWTASLAALTLIVTTRVDPVLLGSSEAGTAPVSATDATDRVYRAWDGHGHPAPMRPELDAEPAPPPEEPDAPRRAFEVVPELSAAIPQCGSRHAGCSELRAATAVGLSAFYRASPALALGASASAAAFGFARGSSEGHVVLAGIAARAYFLERGMLDPYAELTLGAGSLAGSELVAGGRTSDRVTFAPAARIAAGLDFALNPWLKAGPLLAMVRFAPASAERCRGGSCARIEADASRTPLGLTSLGLRLSIGGGDLQ